MTEPDTPLNNAYHVGSFYFLRDEIMELKNQQNPLDIDGQINNLKSLGLIIEDEDQAKEFLNDVSYFRLIKAYSLGLKRKNSNYFDKTTFKQITNLYLFNSNFRQLIFPQIERVEVNLRCRLSNYFSCKYGVLGYENSEYFNNKDYHHLFLEEINKEIRHNKRSPFVKNFSNNYVGGKLPFYAIVELLSFGNLSKFYKNMKNEDKKMISGTYGIGYTYFESWIEHIAFIRNICAHYGRLYNATFPIIPKLYKKDRVDDKSSHMIFATLICLKHLIPTDKHWNEFIDTISLLLEKYQDVQIRRMGFPDNWIDYLT